MSDMALFLLRESPFTRDLTPTLRLAAAGKQSGVVLIQDAVYALLSGGDTPTWRAFREAWDAARARGVSFYALREDMEARGLHLSEGAAAREVTALDYSGLLALILQHKKVI